MSPALWPALYPATGEIKKISFSQLMHRDFHLHAVFGDQGVIGK